MRLTFVSREEELPAVWCTCEFLGEPRYSRNGMRRGEDKQLQIKGLGGGLWKLTVRKMGRGDFGAGDNEPLLEKTIEVAATGETDLDVPVDE